LYLPVKRVSLPKDELPHPGQAIEWWYFIGFLKGKHNYAFMTCLFKADKDKVNLNFLKIPYKNIYFSHSLLFDLDTKEVKKEVLPIVIVSGDTFEREGLFINYFYPLRKSFFNYEISRLDKSLRVKTSFFDLMMEECKKPLLENNTGFIDLGEKTAYYYSYTNLEVNGFIGKEKVKGKAWHDKQWSEKGFMRDSWLWFSLQLPNSMEIVCFDYKGKKMACISYPNDRQETCAVEFIPLKKAWKSQKTGINYMLEWEIRLKDLVIRTKPYINNCEMNFGFINYWEGPLKLEVNGKKLKGAFGFMEYLAEQKKKERDVLKGKFGLMEFYDKKKDALLKKIKPALHLR
jgi:predicted secreted hydrolase